MHLHTVHSDGREMPEKIVTTAKEIGLGVISITDHDTFKGYLEAKELARENKIDLVSGVEITTREGHLLAYGFNPENSDFEEMLKKSREAQREMTEQRVIGLLCEGIPINMGKIDRKFPEHALGKYHIIKTIMSDEQCSRYFAKKGLTSEHRIYAHTLGHGAVAGKTTLEIKLKALEAIEVIASAGGISILAHPSKGGKRVSDFKAILQKIDGIEMQPKFQAHMGDFMEYARENDLMITYGSDLHWYALQSNMLGKGSNVLEQRVLNRLGLK